MRITGMLAALLGAGLLVGATAAPAAAHEPGYYGGHHKGGHNHDDDDDDDDDDLDVKLRLNFTTGDPHYHDGHRRGHGAWCSGWDHTHHRWAHAQRRCDRVERYDRVRGRPAIVSYRVCWDRHGRRYIDPDSYRVVRWLPGHWRAYY